MKEIQEISEYIDEELNDAEKYAKLAIIYKDTHPQLAEVYNRLSTDEMGHVEKLHEAGVKLINDYSSKGETVPASMQAVYDYLHKRQIDKTNRVKMVQNQYKM